MVEQKYIDYWRDRRAKQAAEIQQLMRQAWEDVEQVAAMLRREFGATRIIVFGSLVKPDRFHTDSDIDLAVEGIPPEEFFTAMAAANRLSRRWVDLKPIEVLEPRFRERVFATGKSIDAPD